MQIHKIGIKGAQFILKSQTLLKARSGIPCFMLSYFKCEQNLQTNCFWSYTITTLRVNTSEYLLEKFALHVDSGCKYAARIQNYVLYIRLFPDFARWKTN